MRKAILFIRAGHYEPIT